MTAQIIKFGATHFSPNTNIEYRKGITHWLKWDEVNQQWVKTKLTIDWSLGLPINKFKVGN